MTRIPLPAVELHRETDAPAGEAHSLQRLAEIRLAQGDADEARRLLRRALPLARWSVMANHLLQRIYGTMIDAAPTPETARAIVDQAQATVGERDACSFCAVMFAVPAAIACARVGDLDAARGFIQVGDTSMQKWPRTAWAAALNEARIIGIFARLITRDSKPRYRIFLPRLWRHLQANLEQPGIEGLRAWFDTHVPAEARA